MTDQAPAFALRATVAHPSGEHAREIIAKYAFMGPGIELDRTLPLHEDEQPIVACRVLTRYSGRRLPSTRAGFLRLSSERLCIVRRYAFRSDRVIEIPRGAVVGLSVEKAPVRIQFKGPHGEAEICIVRAAQLGVVESRGTLKQTAADAFVLTQLGGLPRSLKTIAAALDVWRPGADLG